MHTDVLNRFFPCSTKSRTHSRIAGADDGGRGGSPLRPPRQRNCPELKHEAESIRQSIAKELRCQKLVQLFYHDNPCEIVSCLADPVSSITKFAQSAPGLLYEIEEC